MFTKKGFTLLELIIVVIIVAVLASLGITQYRRVIERMRGAEAKTILGVIRSQAAAHWMQYGALDAPVPYDNTMAGIDTAGAMDPELIPGVCAPTHYFSYQVDSAVGSALQATATRCVAGGKTPDAATALTLILNTDFASGVDTWTGTGGY